LGMNEETNNEMDLLLRRLGRRPDKSVSDSNGDIEHLDADELSAYAENVLPAAPRARYTEHLAECTRCRELVVQLSSSAGVVRVAETVKAPEPSALRKFLASLFSPVVLRYAVPALGLIIVAAIGFFVLQQNKRELGSIAQNAEPSKYTGVATPNASAPQAPTSAIVDQVQKEPAATKPAQSSGSPANQTAAAAPQAPPAAGIAGEASREELAKKEQQPLVATDTPDAAAPKAAATPDVSEHQARTEARDEVARGQAAKEPPAAKTEEEANVKAKDRKAAEIKPTGSAPGANATPGFSGLTAMPSSSARARTQRADEEDKDKNDAETRTVAGRHFRKRGGIWIDTAYDSSRSAINLTRGSEQYRALIADEPAIKTIADQLDGEILVVWKGRPYRIK
jgi:hypothetical protein